MQTQKVQLNYLRIAPRKVRLVAGFIRGLPVVDAEAQLRMSPRKASAPILKLLRSAVSAAKQKQMKPNHLFVREIRVDQGPASRRYMPRAMGRATLIQKKTSHIILTLVEAEKPFPARFSMLSKAQKGKPRRKGELQKSDDAKTEEQKKPREAPIIKDAASKKEAPRREGIVKRIFRRKVV